MTPAQKRRIGLEASRIARKLLVSICARRLKKIARGLNRRGSLRAAEEIRQVARLLESTL